MALLAIELGKILSDAAVRVAGEVAGLLEQDIETGNLGKLGVQGLNLRLGLLQILVGFVQFGILRPEGILEVVDGGLELIEAVRSRAVPFVVDIVLSAGDGVTEGRIVVLEADGKGLSIGLVLSFDGGKELFGEQSGQVQGATDEIRQSFQKDDITFESLRHLKYLNIVISEGLKLCSPVPWILPRPVPTVGRTVSGYWLPGDVSRVYLLTPFDTFL